MKTALHKRLAALRHVGKPVPSGGVTGELPVFAASFRRALRDAALATFDQWLEKTDADLHKWVRLRSGNHGL